MKWLTQEVLLGLVIVILLLFGRGLFAQDRATPVAVPYLLTGTWKIETAVADPVTGIRWKLERSGPIGGGAFIQFEAPAHASGCIEAKVGSGDCKRLTIVIDRPADKSGTLAYQAVGRSDKVVFSPDPGASVAFQLNELSLSDYGLVAIRLAILGASEADYGVVFLNPFPIEGEPVAEPSISQDGVPLAHGQKASASKGFPLLGSPAKVKVLPEPGGVLSLCVRTPARSLACMASYDALSLQQGLEVPVSEPGRYEVETWGVNGQKKTSSWVAE